MPTSMDALRSRLTSALSDRRIPVREAEGRVRRAQVDGVPADTFDSGAAETLRRGISLDGGRRDLPDPAVLSKHAHSVSHTWMDGQLFVDGADETDVVQGSIADCYMVASFAAVAATRPEVIENAIRDNGDGTFTVTFQQPSWYGRPTPVEITVDGQLPTEGGNLKYGRGSHRTELWVGLLEKAYAQWKGGYEAVGNGGSPGAVMSALLGTREQYIGLSAGMDADRLFQQLQEAFTSRRAVVAATHGEDQNALYSGTGLYAWHAYTVLGVSEENGQRYVELRNPWGRSEPSGNGPDDGIFKLTVEDFARYYAGVWIN